MPNEKILQDKEDGLTIGFTVTKPDFVREANLKKKKAGQPRENALGQVVDAVTTAMSASGLVSVSVLVSVSMR